MSSKFERITTGLPMPGRVQKVRFRHEGDEAELEVSWNDDECLHYSGSILGQFVCGQAGDKHSLWWGSVPVLSVSWRDVPGLLQLQSLADALNKRSREILRARFTEVPKCSDDRVISVLTVKKGTYEIIPRKAHPDNFRCVFEQKPNPRTDLCELLDDTWHVFTGRPEAAKYVRAAAENAIRRARADIKKAEKALDSLRSGGRGKR